MAKKKDILDRMEASPQNDWKIEDFQKVADQIGLGFKKPTRGSHYTASSVHSEMIETIPYKRPIKAVYVRKFVRLARYHIRAEQNNEREGK
ncbi:hypothetical protein [Celeribacter halophilus]|uniref:hypothetical protein n=1 Tax=Celeribacter halophilus TaxID=576117 RepID=UPI003A8E0E85